MPNPWKTIGHLFYATSSSSFVHHLIHFITICEFKLGLVRKHPIRVKIGKYLPVWPWNLTDNLEKLDELTARRKLKSPPSLSGISIHLTLVTKWSWSWSWMAYCHALYAMSICPPILRYSYFKYELENPWSRSCVWSEVKVTMDLQNSKVKVVVKVNPIGHIWAWCSIDMFAFPIFVAIVPLLAEIQEIPFLSLKIQDPGHGQGQTRWSHLSPRFQLICLNFVSWQSDHFWLRYSKFYIWPWKFKIKVMAKVKPDGHIWALEFNRYVCFSFYCNQTVFGWDKAISIFDLEKFRSSSRQKIDQNLHR